MRVVGIMPCRNEAGRYLEASVSWLLEHVVDELFVYDDRSTDASCAIAVRAGAVVATRPEEAPSFADNESAFREAAWTELGRSLRLTTSDWVLSVDADEFPVTHPDDPRHGDVGLVLSNLAHIAMATDRSAIGFPVVELFDAHRGQLMVRTDGYWSTITADRFARWCDPQFIRRSGYGSGSLPAAAGPVLRTDELVILHAGYLTAEDRVAKYERYRDDSGHASDHVRSILEPPRLRPWTGLVPPMARGEWASA